MDGLGHGVGSRDWVGRGRGGDLGVTTMAEAREQARLAGGGGGVGNACASHYGGLLLECGRRRDLSRCISVDGECDCSFEMNYLRLVEVPAVFIYAMASGILVMSSEYERYGAMGSSPTHATPDVGVGAQNLLSVVVFHTRAAWLHASSKVSPGHAATSLGGTWPRILASTSLRIARDTSLGIGIRAAMMAMMIEYTVRGR